MMTATGRPQKHFCPVCNGWFKLNGQRVTKAGRLRRYHTCQECRYKEQYDALLPAQAGEGRPQR